MIVRTRRFGTPRFAEDGAGRAAGAFTAREIAAACMILSDTRLESVVSGAGVLFHDVSLERGGDSDSWTAGLDLEPKKTRRHRQTVSRGESRWRRQRRSCSAGFISSLPYDLKRAERTRPRDSSPVADPQAAKPDALSRASLRRE